MRFALVMLLVACRPPGWGRHTGVDAADPGPDGSHASVDAAPDGSSGASCTHGFRLDGHSTSQSVWLSGDFVQWAGDPPHGAVAFTLGADGGWTGSHTFAAGSYQYKFIIDGSQWIADPTDTNTVPDGLGCVNSVYVCMP